MLFRSFPVTVLKHVVNLGKGGALKTGFDFAISKGAENLVAIDADLQHHATDIPKFIDALTDADVIFGYREFNKDMPSILRLGNTIITKVMHVLFQIKLQDTQCGFRACKAKIYPKIRWEATDYFMESEMIAKVGEEKCSFKEIPIKTIYGDKYKGTTEIGRAHV